MSRQEEAVLDHVFQAPFEWQQSDWHVVDRAMTHHHAVMVQSLSASGGDALLACPPRWRFCQRPQGEHLCGECSPCRLTMSFNHPDLVYLWPTAQLQRCGMTIPQAWLGGAGKTSEDIRIDQVRWLIEWAWLSPRSATGKIAVIYPAEAMNAASSNALLKLLEEPPPSLRLLLGTHRMDALMPTLLSRCQRVTLTTPNAGQVERWLSDAGFEGAPSLAKWVGGRPFHASRLHASYRWLKAWLSAGRAASDDAVHELDSASMLEAMTRCATDLLRVNLGLTPVFVEPADLVNLRSDHISRDRVSEFLRQQAGRVWLSEHTINQKWFREAVLIEFSRCFETNMRKSLRPTQ